MGISVVLQVFSHIPMCSTKNVEHAYSTLLITKVDKMDVRVTFEANPANSC